MILITVFNLRINSRARLTQTAKTNSQIVSLKLILKSNKSDRIKENRLNIIKTSFNRLSTLKTDSNGLVRLKTDNAFLLKIVLVTETSLFQNE